VIGRNRRDEHAERHQDTNEDEQSLTGALHVFGHRQENNDVKQDNNGERQLGDAAEIKFIVISLRWQRNSQSVCASPSPALAKI